MNPELVNKMTSTINEIADQYDVLLAMTSAGNLTNLSFTFVPKVEPNINVHMNVDLSEEKEPPKTKTTKKGK